MKKNKKSLTICADSKSYTYKNPEEKVRASYFTELTLDYGYSTDRIKFEIKVPRRAQNDFADITQLKYRTVIAENSR